RIVGGRGGGIVFADMRGALETSAARPLKDGRKTFGWSLVFGSVNADAYDILVRMCEDVVKHAFRHIDAELAIDRRNEPRTHRKITVRCRKAIDEPCELRLVRHAV